MAKRPCLDCGVPASGYRCVGCAARHKPVGWRRISKAVLARDGFRCQVGLPGCLGVARDAAHIDPRGPGVPENLRAACHPCNAREV